MSELTKVLRNGEQADMDGVMVLISRQAVMEAADEIERLQAEVSAFRDVLIRNGFVQCDIAACNCGSWHARYGLTERFREFKDMMEEAGFPCSNANGNLARNALAELIAEVARLREDADESRRLLRLAKCPDCDGCGYFVHQYEAGVFEQEQCQWCYERHQVAPPTDAAIDAARIQACRAMR